MNKFLSLIVLFLLSQSALAAPYCVLSGDSGPIISLGATVGNSASYEVSANYGSIAAIADFDPSGVNFMEIQDSKSGASSQMYPRGGTDARGAMLVFTVGTVGYNLVCQ